MSDNKLLYKKNDNQIDVGIGTIEVEKGIFTNCYAEICTTKNVTTNSLIFQGGINIENDLTINRNLNVTGNVNIMNNINMITSDNLISTDKTIILKPYDTLDGAGLIIKGIHNKSLIIQDNKFLLNEDLNISRGNTYKINNINVLESNNKLSRSIIYSNIEKVGTINTGNWKGSPISLDKGGTGQGNFINGDILYGDNLNSLSKLSSKSNNSILTIGRELVPEWRNLSRINILSSITEEQQLNDMNLCEEWFIGGNPKSITENNSRWNNENWSTKELNIDSSHLFTNNLNTTYLDNTEIKHYNYLNNNLTIKYNGINSEGVSLTNNNNWFLTKANSITELSNLGIGSATYHFTFNQNVFLSKYDFTTSKNNTSNTSNIQYTLSYKNNNVWTPLHEYTLENSISDDIIISPNYNNEGYYSVSDSNYNHDSDPNVNLLLFSSPESNSSNKAYTQEVFSKEFKFNVKSVDQSTNIKLYNMRMKGFVFK